MGQTINPFGKEITKVSTEFCGKTLTLEVGRVGFRSSSSVIVRYGDTVILGTAMVGDEPAAGMDYFPLSIDYEEKMYAAGKISGSRFVKREGRPSDDAILLSRLIDRPIRPLWPKGYRNQVQGIASVLSMDPDFRPDMIAMIAISTALSLTGAPFSGPVAGLRIGLNEAGDFVPFATRSTLEDGKLDLVVAGTETGVMMVEAGAREVDEEQVISAIEFAQEKMQPAIALQNELVEKLGAKAQEYELDLPDEEIQKVADDWTKGKLGDSLRIDYPERNAKIADLRTAYHEAMADKLGDDYPDIKAEYDEAFTMSLHKDARAGIIEKQSRPDGRKLTEIRPLSSEVGILPRVHGSSIFTRGVTQGMNIVTLAPLRYAQLIDTMEKDEEKRFFHHYNAPGYTVGEVKRLMGPGRREIGHSYLAERALDAVLPSETDFPYTIRSVTEIMSQNGSTSMAAACSSCLALMDAGVPLIRPVSGIAMGLMLDKNTPYILSDIADAEDFAGDMDFKVTGTTEGITALQMDMKVHGLSPDILRKALLQGKDGRLEILEHMLTTLSAPRDDLSKYAPRIESVKVAQDRIRDIIGKGGETIQRITAETGTEIDIQDDGTVVIASPDKTSIEAAKEWIQKLTEEPEVGKTYNNCRVVTVLDFGAFVEILPGKEGLVHVSEMKNERVESPSDVVSEGDEVSVKLVAIDDRGRLQLSMKAVDSSKKSS